MVEVDTAEGKKSVSFDHCIIAAGSQAARIPGFPYDDPRLMDSTSALELTDIPKRMLVIGGGIIGLEMATVYDALGSKITVVELLDGLIPGADRDIIRPLHKRIEKRYEGDPAQDQGDQNRGAARGVARHVRRRGCAGTAGVRPHPAVGGPPPQRQGHQCGERPACRSTSAASSR